MRRDGGIDERFAAYVRERGEHHLRVAVLLTGDWHVAQDLVQASLVKALGGLSIFPGFLGSVDPQDLLALLQSATDVREVGPASGLGWTGSAYSFTVATTLNGPVHTPVGLRGMVDVDQQGRVRQLDGQAWFATTVS